MRNTDIQFAILATDVVIFCIDDGRLKVLLTKSTAPQFKSLLAIPGGLVKPSESLSKSSDRFIASNIKTQNIYKEQLYTFGDPGRDPNGRVVSVSYLVLTSSPVNKISAATWHDVDTLPLLAYDHNKIVSEARKRLQSKITYTNIAFALLPNEFTLTDLQGCYETILGKKLDKRNFRKKISSLKIIKQLPKLKKGQPSRPARLFKFVSRKIQIVEIL